MIDMSMKVWDYCKSLPKRLDGQLLICAIAACIVMLVINIFVPVSKCFGVNWPGKWIFLWATWPFVLFIGHIRLRILFHKTGISGLIIHTLLMPGSVIYFILKNMGVICRY
jgi:hypothetical protein